MKKSFALNVTMLFLGTLLFSCASTNSSFDTTTSSISESQTSIEESSSISSDFSSITESSNSIEESDSISSSENSDKVYFTKRQSVLLLGQSNMAGRGDLGDVEVIDDDRIFMIRDNSWTKMVEPIHTDKTAAGIGLAASFAKGFVDAFDCEVGLIPGAYGGTSLGDWAVNGTYYTRALEMAKAAQKDSEICAILWHQGESNQSSSSNYANKLKVILDSFITDLNLDAEQIVIVSGELGEFRTDARLNINNALQELKSMYSRYDVATAEGLKAKADQTHFNSESLRVFGYRYFNIFHKFITGTNYEYIDDIDYYYIGEGREDVDAGGGDDTPDTPGDKVRYEMEGTIVEDTYISASNSTAKNNNYASSTYIGTKKDTSRPLFKFNLSNILTYSMFEENKDDGILEFTFSFVDGASNITDDTTCNVYGFLPGKGVSDADFTSLTWNTCSENGTNKELYRKAATFIIENKPFSECGEIEKTSSTIKYKIPYSNVAQFVNIEEGDTYGILVMGFDFNVGSVKYASMENTSLPIPRVDFVHYEDK